MRDVQIQMHIWQLALLVGAATAYPITAAGKPAHHPDHTQHHTLHQRGGPKPHSRSLESPAERDKAPEATNVHAAQIAAANLLKSMHYMGEVHGFQQTYPGVLDQVFELAQNHLAEKKDAHMLEELQMLKDELAAYNANGDASWTNDRRNRDVSLVMDMLPEMIADIDAMPEYQFGATSTATPTTTPTTTTSLADDPTLTTAQKTQIATVNALKNMRYMGEVHGFQMTYPGVLEKAFELARSDLTEKKDAHMLEELQLLMDEVAAYNENGEASWTNDRRNRDVSLVMDMLPELIGLDLVPGKHIKTTSTTTSTTTPATTPTAIPTSIPTAISTASLSTLNAAADKIAADKAAANKAAVDKAAADKAAADRAAADLAADNKAALDKAAADHIVAYKAAADKAAAAQAAVDRAAASKAAADKAAADQAAADKAAADKAAADKAAALKVAADKAAADKVAAAKEEADRAAAFKAAVDKAVADALAAESAAANRAVALKAAVDKAAADTLAATRATHPLVSLHPLPQSAATRSATSTTSGTTSATTSGTTFSADALARDSSGVIFPAVGLALAALICFGIVLGSFIHRVRSLRAPSKSSRLYGASAGEYSPRKQRTKLKQAILSDDPEGFEAELDSPSDYPKGDADRDFD